MQDSRYLAACSIADTRCRILLATRSQLYAIDRPNIKSCCKDGSSPVTFFLQQPFIVDMAFLTAPSSEAPPRQGDRERHGAQYSATDSFPALQARKPSQQALPGAIRQLITSSSKQQTASAECGLWKMQRKSRQIRIHACAVCKNTSVDSEALFAVGAGQSREHRLFTSPEMQHTLALHMVPLLTLRELAVTASTCTALRDMVYQCTKAWTDAAAAHLPACHPSVSGCDLASLQRLLQRRLEARRNVSLGKTNSHVRISGFTDSVQALHFSPCGSRLFVATCDHITVFALPFGSEHQKWRASLAELQEACCTLLGKESCGIRAWFHGQEVITACSQAWDLDDLTIDANLHVFRYSALTGASLGVGCSYDFASIIDFDLPESAVISADKMQFSNNGHFLAVSLGISGAMESGLDSSAHLVILDVDNEVVLWHITLKGSEHFGSVPCAIWSSDSTMVMAGNRLARLQDNHITDFKDFHYTALNAVQFNRAGDVLGFNLDSPAGADSPRMAFAVFLDVKSGTELFRVEGKRFCTFFTTRKCALLQPMNVFDPNDDAMEVWDLVHHSCIRSVTGLANAMGIWADRGLHFTLDDQFLTHTAPGALADGSFRKSFWEISSASQCHQPLLFDNDGRMAGKICLSPDECIVCSNNYGEHFVDVRWLAAPVAPGPQ